MPPRVDKKFTKPMSLGSWIVVIFVPPNRFSPNEAKETINGLVKGCEAVGELFPPPLEYLQVLSSLSRHAGARETAVICS